MPRIYDFITACPFSSASYSSLHSLYTERMEHLHTFLVLLFLFCSPWLSAGTTFLTHLGTQCKEDCKPDGGEYKCKTIDKDGRSQTMYCSPQENMDYWSRRCRADSMCGKHGEDYYWCRINIFTWGYCGLVKDDKKIIESVEVTYISSRHRNKRVREVIATEDDKGNRIKTIFYSEPAPDAITDGRHWSDEANALIGQWDNGYLVDQQRSNLIRSTNLRIDMQGIINRANHLYYNMQIQINNIQRNGGSTTVSQIIVPRGIPERYIRRAFWESFRNRARVSVEVSPY